MRQVQQPSPVSPVPPANPPNPGIQGAPYVFTPGGRSADPVEVLRGARAQREELREQLSNLEERREELSRELRQRAEGADRAGVERRIAEIDQRISEVDKQLAAAEMNVARSAAIPGAVVPDPPPLPEAGPPEGVVMITTVFTVLVLFPLTIAYARRLWRRGAASVAELPRVLAERITRLDQAVDAIAIEVERISEGQRFLTKLMSEAGGRSLGSGPAPPIDVGASEAARVPRSTSQ